MISVRGARTHNLKNIHIDLPRDQFIVITGLSGSGKSSLAFDTLYAEGQRRYVESLSAYARQFLSMMEKPDVDAIEGLSPAISIEQKATSHHPRSTVGTMTEIYDYLRLLYARVGSPYCPQHGIHLHAQTVSQMVDQILTLPEHARIMILAPVVRDRKGEHTQLFQKLQAQGYVRLRLDGTLYEIDALPVLNRQQKHTIEVVVDRLKVHPDHQVRLSDSLESALKLSEGFVIVASMEGLFDDKILSASWACPSCGYALKELAPRLFSFNNPAGACPVCDGLGVRYETPFDTMSSEQVASFCEACEGTRLKPAARAVLLEGRSLPEIANDSVEAALKFFKQLKLTGQKAVIAEKITQEVVARLTFLMNVGLDYLTLSRAADTLSGGEAQRIRLASQIGSGLVGVMYVLDEPSIGLHQRDNERLLETLIRLRDLGNTVIVVEHDEDAILRADHVVDMGPFAGVHGGYVVAQGTPEEIRANPNSLTGQYLSRQQIIEVPSSRTPCDPTRSIILEGVYCHNLSDLRVSIPVGLMTCVTGVSGSGKSSLIMDVLYPVANHRLNRARLMMQGRVASIEGLEHCDKVIQIDQSPIGRTPRSNPATYTGLLTPIRELFAQLPEARARGYTPGRFSFNVKGGRCEACEGEGFIKVEMNFLPDIYVTCDVCQGARYNRETLEIRYKGYHIHDVLEMTVDEARVFFDAVPVLAKKCQILCEVGLSYLKLGQSATTLSGGEAQRIKLTRELSKRDTGRTLYILDEPTTGLHFHDVKQLLQVLCRLKGKGNTIVMIEHHLDVIKTADWIIDLGPEGGTKGGKVVVEGTPEQVALCPISYTGLFLKTVLAR